MSVSVLDFKLVERYLVGMRLLLDIGVCRNFEEFSH